MTPDEVQNEIDDFNENAKQEAQECFSEQIGREMAFSCQRFKTIADNCTEALENLKPFAGFGSFDRDEIARIYVTDTTIQYDGYDLDMSGNDVDSDDWNDYAISELFFTDADEAYERQAFIDSFEKYLETAAKSAKRIESAAEAAYLEALALSKETKTEYSRLALSAEEALKLIKLEENAANTLSEDLGNFNNRKI